MLPLVTKIDSQRAHKRVLQAVASLEFTKGIFVLLMGLCAILLVHKDAWEIADNILSTLHINTDRRSAQLFLDFADNITDARLWAAAKLAFVYSAMRFAEGYGLWNERTWAEWLAFGSGMLLIPLEIRELLRGVTFLRSAVFLINIGVVIYMFFLLKQGRLKRRQLAAAQARTHAKSEP